jgi:hypothetical protein
MTAILDWLATPVQSERQAFDLMSLVTEADWPDGVALALWVHLTHYLRACGYSADQLAQEAQRFAPGHA